MTWEKLQGGPGLGVAWYRLRTADGWLVAIRLNGPLGRWLRTAHVPDPAGDWIPAAWERLMSEGHPPIGADLYRTPVPAGTLIYAHISGFSGPGGDITFVPAGGAAR